MLMSEPANPEVGRRRGFAKMNVDVYHITPSRKRFAENRLNQGFVQMFPDIKISEIVSQGSMILVTTPFRRVPEIISYSMEVVCKTVRHSTPGQTVLPFGGHVIRL